jgi:C-terminal processing protease CtpA/Prc
MKDNQLNRYVLVARCAVGLLSLCLLANVAMAQDLDAGKLTANRDRGLLILSRIKEVIKGQYYDPKFHGLDLDKHFKAASARIKQLDTAQQIFTVIAQVVLDFNDSHTTYIPPPRVNEVEYGFSMQMIGDICRVVRVKQGGNAEAQGLKVGEIIIDISGHRPRRNSLWLVTYLLYALDPQPEVRLSVIGLDGRVRELTIPARLVTKEERKHESTVRKEQEKIRPDLKPKPYKCHEVNNELIACKLYTFSVEPSVVDKMMKEVGEHGKMILDLRGNGGGFVETDMHLIGYFFDHDVKIGKEFGRVFSDDRIARSQKSKSFTGKLVVLIDSRSASASEVFARVVQIEKRGSIVGDSSAGEVMASRPFQLDTEPVFGWISVTIGDLVMSDGQRLEGIGVVPDFLNLPNGHHLAEGSDPTLAFAASLCGAVLSKEEAGHFYFSTNIPQTGDHDDGPDK